MIILYIFSLFIISAANGSTLRSLCVNRSWDRTSACYQQLVRDCAADSEAVSVLRAHLRRYLVYSRPCLDRSQRSQYFNASLYIHAFIQDFITYLGPYLTFRLTRTAGFKLGTALFSKSQNPLHQFFRSKSATSPQHIFLPLLPYGE